MGGKMWSLIFQTTLITHLLCDVTAQVARGTSRFYELLQEGVDILDEQIQDHPDVRYHFDPSKELLFADVYSFVFPDIEDYRIGILMDPVL
jgi:hypothetical protein